jgi:multidrug transporter EmrE-like cation transporter
MINLVLSILCSISVLIIFKVLKKLKIKIYHVIIANYAVASTLGLLTSGSTDLLHGSVAWQTPWFPPAIIIGIFFITMFFVIGISTQKAGLVVTTISTRMSVVIPITFSIIFYREQIHVLKVCSVVLALIALVCSNIKPNGSALQHRRVLFPAILFFGMGTLHVVIKYTQQAYIAESQSGAFTGTCFFFAFASGVVLSLIRRVSLKTFFARKVFWMGVLLGSCNFGTVFFLVNALNQEIFDSSIIFGINATGIVAGSVMAGAVVFKERLSTVNWIGVGLSMVSIVLLFNA